MLLAALPVRFCSPEKMFSFESVGWRVLILQGYIKKVADIH